MKRATLVGAVLLIIALALTTVSGCSSSKSLTIGIIGDLSGTLAAYGTDTLQGAQIAVDEINAAGGINGKQLKLQVFDEKNDPIQSVQIAQQVGDECIAVVVGSGSSPALAMGPYLEKAGIPFIVTVSSNPKVTSSGWKWASRVQLSDKDQVERLIDYASKNLAISKFAILHDTSDLGVGAKDAALAAIQTRGLQATDVESWQQSDVDFSSQLLNAKRSGAQAIIVWGAAEGGARIAQQAKKLGVNLQILGGNAFGNQRFLDLAGSAAEGVIITWGSVNPDLPKAAGLAQQMKDKYNRQADVFVAQAYDVVHVLADAIKAGGNNREAIQKAIRSGQYDGAIGQFSFDANGHNVRKIDVAKVVNGTFKLVD